MGGQLRKEPSSVKSVRFLSTVRCSKKADLTDTGYPVFSGYRIVGQSLQVPLCLEPEIVVVARWCRGHRRYILILSPSLFVFLLKFFQ